MLRILDGSGNGVLAVEIEGGYTKSDFEACRDAFEEQLSQGHDKVDILLKLDRMDLGRTSTVAFVEDGRYALGHMENIGRIAVVGHSGLTRLLVRGDNAVFGRPGERLEEKYFDVSDMDAAWDFIRS